jgi:hypothetical protein
MNQNSEAFILGIFGYIHYLDQISKALAFKNPGLYHFFKIVLCNFYDKGLCFLIDFESIR